MVDSSVSNFRSLFHRWLTDSVSPVMLSTLSDGKIVNNLTGIPSEGPAIFVGYHMLMGWDLTPLISRLLCDRGIHLRAVAHPIIFDRFSELMMPDYSSFDNYRLMGAVPVSAKNIYKLLSSKSFVLLFPGGAREALHRKASLFWKFIKNSQLFLLSSVEIGTLWIKEMRIKFLTTFHLDNWQSKALGRITQTTYLLFQETFAKYKR